jgi:hypothetical protein
MSIANDISLSPRAQNAIRRCLAAAQPDPGAPVSDPATLLHQPAAGTPVSDPASAPPLCCCIQANLRGRPGWSVDPIAWLTRTDLSAALTDKAVRRAYAAQAIRKTQVKAILGKDLSWGVVYYRIRSRQHARLYVIPADPLTPARERMRAIMKTVSKVYSDPTVLTPKQRRAWMAAAKEEWSRRRLTQGRLTGQALFVKRNTVMARVGRELLLWPPEPASFGPNPVEAVIPSYENGQFRLAVKVSGPWEEDLMVVGEGQVGPKRKKLHHPVYLGLLPAAAGGLSDITAQYVGRFGEPASGKKVLIGVQPQVNGWKGRMQVLGEVVPAKRGVNNQGTKEQRRDVGGREFREVPEFRRVASRCTRDRFRGAAVVLPRYCGGKPCGDRTPAMPARGCLRPVWRVGRAGSGGGVAKNRRKCHWRARWRGT